MPPSCSRTASLARLARHVLPPLFFLACGLRAAEPLRIREARASSTAPASSAARAVDGDRGENSRWLSAPAASHWLELDLGGVHALAGLHLFSGYKGGDALGDFTVQFRRDDRWVDIPSAIVTGNRATALVLRFDDTMEIKTDRLRLFITATPKTIARVSEIVVWPAGPEGVPPIPAADRDAAASGVFLNQSGFNAGAPKRFTAPNASDGAAFIVRAADAAPKGPALFTGSIRGGVGDFTAFEPDDDREYVVTLGEEVSVPFRIGQWWLERVTYQRAVDFMIDSRNHLGNVRRPARGSVGWRDDHHFGWELHTLVPQWISNPSAYARMPRQIRYEAPADPALWGALQPPAADAPDLVKLIHWGADVIVTQGRTHEMLKAQLPYFLYAWPALSDYLPAQNYTVVRDYTFAHWRDTAADSKYPYDESAADGHDLLALKDRVGSTKGGYPPGFSIEPNLLLHAVALREGRADAAEYLDAALRQAEWIVAHVDWNDPLTTKGQRMSEFITLTGLAHLLRAHPDRAPAGLAAKINAWAAVVVRRSENLWDFRKLGDRPDQWAPLGEKPTMWNEPGNVVGLPAAILAARPFITDAAVAARLDQLVWSHFDSMFGRNPTGRHFSYDAPRELEGVERGWFSFYVGGVGQLEETRFVLDGSPKNQHFPFHPEIGNVGWSEGWVQHNTPFNLSLAYLAHADTRLAIGARGDRLELRLIAPLNFDYHRAETATVVVRSAGGDEERVTLAEDGMNARGFTGTIPLKAAAARKGDGILQAAANERVTATYGFGYLGHETAIDAP